MTAVGYEAAKRERKQENKIHEVKCKYFTSNKIRRIENTRAVERTAAELRLMQKATPIIK